MIYGFDVSTSIIGCARFLDNGNFIDAQHLDLRKLETNLIDKSDLVYTWLDKLSDNCDKNISVYVEDRLQNFATGKTMLQTLMKLAAFNSTVSWIAWNRFKNKSSNCTIEHIHPSKVKGLMRKEGLIIPKGEDKKKLTLDFVCKREPLFVLELNRNNNPQPYMFDRADAYCVALAGIREFNDRQVMEGKSTKESIR